MDRRGFIKLAGLATTVFWAPQAFGEGSVAASGGGQKVLVLVELKGGNDGLNTVVPFGEAAYYNARPRLAIGKDQVLKLNERVGLHPKLAPLMEGWKGKELAIVQGVGYARPNRSHFRSIEIWERGSESGHDRSGWLARLWDAQPGRASAAAGAIDGVVIGGEDVGPLQGASRSLTMRRPEQMIRAVRHLERLGDVKVGQGQGNAALSHVLSVRDDLMSGARTLEQHVKRARRMRGKFGRSALGRQLEQAARLVASGLPLAVIKVTLGGFDTHANQPGRHARLLGQLAQELAAFRAAMKAAGCWDQVLVMTYSEFGRRVAQNGSGGTDHGTAAPQLVMGGAVKGGLYGAQPSLVDLAGGDLKHHVDFRQLYATVARKWWSMSQLSSELQGQALLGIL